MTPNDVLKSVTGLKRDQLTYYVRMDYISPSKYKRGNNDYTEFSDKDLEIIKKAYYLIEKFGTTPKKAFSIAQEQYNQPTFEI